MIWQKHRTKIRSPEKKSKKLEIKWRLFCSETSSVERHAELRISQEKHIRLLYLQLYKLIFFSIDGLFRKFFSIFFIPLIFLPQNKNKSEKTIYLKHFSDTTLKFDQLVETLQTDLRNKADRNVSVKGRRGEV